MRLMVTKAKHATKEETEEQEDESEDGEDEEDEEAEEDEEGGEDEEEDEEDEEEDEEEDKDDNDDDNEDEDEANNAEANAERQQRQQHAPQEQHGFLGEKTEPPVISTRCAKKSCMGCHQSSKSCPGRQFWDCTRPDCNLSGVKQGVKQGLGAAVSRPVNRCCGNCLRNHHAYTGEDLIATKFVCPTCKGLPTPDRAQALRETSRLCKGLLCKGCCGFCVKGRVCPHPLHREKGADANPAGEVASEEQERAAAVATPSWKEAASAAAAVAKVEGGGSNAAVEAGAGEMPLPKAVKLDAAANGEVAAVATQPAAATAAVAIGAPAEQSQGHDITAWLMRIGYAQHAELFHQQEFSTTDDVIWAEFDEEVRTRNSNSTCQPGCFV